MRGEAIPVDKEDKMKSFIAKPHEVERSWYVVDAEGKTLGRLATEVASILRGKKKPTFTPHVDCGDGKNFKNQEEIFCREIGRASCRERV